MVWCLIGSALSLVVLGFMVLRVRMPQRTQIQVPSLGGLVRGCLASILVGMALLLIGLALLGSTNP